MRKGIYFVLLTTTISGFSVFANKIFVSQTDPLVFTAVRNVLVGLLLSTVLLASNQHKKLATLTKKDWLKLLFIGICGGGVAFALFFTGLAQIGAVSGNLIHKTLYLWVAVLAIPILHERPTLKQIVGYGLIFWATYFIAGASEFKFSQGSLLVLGATILWALENVVAKITLKNISSQVIGWARIVIGIPVLFGITFFFGKGQLFFDPKTYLPLPILTSALFLTGYVLTWYAGLKHLPATVATSVLVLAPIITAILSGVFITHSPLPQPQIWSFIEMTLGVALITLKLKLPKTSRFPFARE